MQQKYGALRVISLFYRLLGVLAIIGGIVALIASIATPRGDLATGIAALIGACIGAVVLFGLGELFQVFIDLEENQRTNTAILKQYLKSEAGKRA